MDTIFHKIAAREVPAYVIAEDADYMAFLDAFPITPAQVVVIPKQFQPSQFSIVDSKVMAEAINFAQNVAQQLETKLDNVLRVTVAIEGLEIDYFHIKLYPVYKGVKLPSHGGGEKANDEDLKSWHEKLTT